MRGAWLVGPMNRPENRYESDGQPLPVEHDALEQVRPAQERTVGRRRTAEHDVVAAAGAGVAAVDHELVGAEP